MPLSRRGWIGAVSLLGAPMPELEAQTTPDPPPKLWRPAEFQETRIHTFTLMELYRLYADCSEDLSQPTLVACDSNFWNLMTCACRVTPPLMTDGPFGKQGYLSFWWMKAEVIMTREFGREELWILTPSKPHSKRHNGRMCWYHSDK